jgi:hypothetical protein
MSREELTTCFYVDLLGTARPREFDLSPEAVGLPPVDLSGLEAHFMDEEIVTSQFFFKNKFSSCIHGICISRSFPKF